MKIASRKSLLSAAAVLFGTAALLVACNGSEPSVTPNSAADLRAGASAGHSIPVPGPKYLYVSSWPSSVYSYDYPLGTFRFTLTGGGFNKPDGQCVDGPGNVFITNYGNGKTFRYNHAGTARTHTYLNAGAAAVGCAVFGPGLGDLAVTYHSTVSGTAPGEVLVWTGEIGAPTAYPNPPAACYDMWPGGFDSLGNLFVEGEPNGGGAVSVCELTAPPRSWVAAPLTLTFTIDAPGSAMWDGAYITLTDTEAGGTYETGIDRVTLSGTTLTLSGDTVLTDVCYSDYVDTPQPFILGHHNTPINGVQGTVVVGGNIFCNMAGAPKFDYWIYPAGGSPSGQLSGPPPSPEGQSISL
ncbi:MAG TPA: SMP-30/gluconolactonase/LRE family protein [Candidatus Cybelea sp.]|nr:SMP-30/gluconolactonase/LRE family protein [Candidatus Cybelea sp.]